MAFKEEDENKVAPAIVKQDKSETAIEVASDNANDNSEGADKENKDSENLAATNSFGCKKSIQFE